MSGVSPVQRQPFLDAPRYLSLYQETYDSVVFTNDGILCTTDDYEHKTVPNYLKALGVDMPQSLKNINADNNAHEKISARIDLSGGSIAEIAIGSVLGARGFIGKWNLGKQHQKSPEALWPPSTHQTASATLIFKNFSLPTTRVTLYLSTSNYQELRSNVFYHKANQFRKNQYGIHAE